MIANPRWRSSCKGGCPKRPSVGLRETWCRDHQCLLTSSQGARGTQARGLSRPLCERATLEGHQDDRRGEHDSVGPSRPCYATNRSPACSNLFLYTPMVLKSLTLLLQPSEQLFNHHHQRKRGQHGSLQNASGDQALSPVTACTQTQTLPHDGGFDS